MGSGISSETATARRLNRKQRREAFYKERVTAIQNTRGRCAVNPLNECRD